MSIETGVTSQPVLRALAQQHNTQYSQSQSACAPPPSVCMCVCVRACVGMRNDSKCGYI